MNKGIVIIIAIVVIGFGAWYFMKGDYTEKKDEMQATSTPEEALRQAQDEAVMGVKQVVIYTDQGFSPSPLMVKMGETVEFKNMSSHKMWPASAMHPSHTGYPGTDIQRCGTAGAGMMFDACAGIASGGSWPFTFSEKGEWAYHDHMNAKYFGKIIVE